MDAGRQNEFRRLAGCMDLREAPALLRQLSECMLKAFRALKAANGDLRRTEDEIASMINSLLRRDDLL